MKPFLSIALGMLALISVFAETRQKPPVPRRGSADEALIALEKQIWTLIKQRDLKAYAGLMADDYYEIFPEGEVYTKGQVLKFFENEFVLKEYSLGGFQVVMLNREAGIVVYKASVQGVNKGKDEAYRVACVSGWARRGGKWLNVFYQENYIK